MKAILLAAGRGTRIDRNVERVPKSTLPIDGVPLIRRSVELLQEAKMECVVCTGYEEGKIKEAMSELDNITYCYNPFYDITNSIASIWFAREYMDDDMLVMNADVFFSKEILEQIIADKRNPVMAIDYSRTAEGDYFIKITMLDRNGTSIGEVKGYIDKIEAGKEKTISIKVSADIVEAYDVKIERI